MNIRPWNDQNDRILNVEMIIMLEDLIGNMVIDLAIDEYMSKI